MLGLGTTELLILLVLVLIFFGAGKLASVGSLFGRLSGYFTQGKRDAEAIDITPSTKEKTD